MAPLAWATATFCCAALGRLLAPSVSAGRPRWRLLSNEQRTKAGSCFQGLRVEMTHSGRRAPNLAVIHNGFPSMWYSVVPWLWKRYCNGASSLSCAFSPQILYAPLLSQSIEPSSSIIVVQPCNKHSLPPSENGSCEAATDADTALERLIDESGDDSVGTACRVIRLNVHNV